MLPAPRRTLTITTVVATIAALAACTPEPPAVAPAPSISSSAAVEPAPSTTPTTEAATGPVRPAGAPTVLAGGLAAPWSVAPLPAGGALISQRDDGTIVEVATDGTVRAVGVVPDVVPGGESGLHGLVIFEDGATTWLYAYHGSDADNRVVRIPLTGASGSLALGAAEPIVTGIARANTHNGGRIAFGPDGMLYVATGDAQNRPASQDPDSLNGKILRVTPEGAAAPGNPYGNAVYSLGHRNVQGIAWTPDGRMWASEFGQNTFDELNEIVAGGNYGWPVVEGASDDDRFVHPVAQWATADASPSGIAAVGGTVFMTGLRGERLWAIDVGAGGAATAVLDGLGRLRDAVAAPDGSLWVLTNNTDGRGAPRDGDDVLVRVELTGA